MEFSGFLLKNNRGGILDRYIQFNTYSSTPNKRETLIEYRDDNTRNLTRVMSVGKKSDLVFTTTPVDLQGKNEIQKFFKESMVDELERKIQLTYWNDEDNEYRTSFFYLPDILFVIKKINSNNIFYQPFTVSLIEY